MLHSGGCWLLLLLWAVWSLFQAVAPRDFMTLYGLSSGPKVALTVPVCLLGVRDSSLNCSLEKLWRLCSLPRQSVPHVSVLHNLMLLSCNLSPLVLEAGEQLVPSILQLFLCVWERLSCLPAVSCTPSYAITASQFITQKPGCCWLVIAFSNCWLDWICTSSL